MYLSVSVNKSDRKEKNGKWETGLYHAISSEKKTVRKKNKEYRNKFLTRPGYHMLCKLVHLKKWNLT